VSCVYGAPFQRMATNSKPLSFRQSLSHLLLAASLEKFMLQCVKNRSPGCRDYVKRFHIFTMLRLGFLSLYCRRRLLPSQNPITVPTPSIFAYNTLHLTQQIHNHQIFKFPSDPLNTFRSSCTKHIIAPEVCTNYPESKFYMRSIGRGVITQGVRQGTYVP